MAYRIVDYRQKIVKHSRQKGVISFVGSDLDGAVKTRFEKLFRGTFWRLWMKRSPDWLYTPPIIGHPGLLSELAAQFGGNKSHYLVVSGVQQALNLICQVLTRTGDTIITEKATYMALEGVVKVRGLAVANWPQQLNRMSEEEIGVFIRKVKPKLIYCNSFFANPTGESVDERRWQYLVKLSVKYNFFIIDDAAYSHIAYEGNGTWVKHKTPGAHTLQVNSVSKMFGPALKLGWVRVTDKTVLAALTLQKEIYDMSEPSLTQLMVAELFGSANIMENFRRFVQDHYAEKMKTLCVSLEEQLPKGFTYQKPLGGMFVWVEGPGTFQAGKHFLKAIQKGVAYVPAEYFCLVKPIKNAFRLSIADVEKDAILPGVKRLSKSLSRF